MFWKILCFLEFYLPVQQSRASKKMSKWGRRVTCQVSKKDTTGLESARGSASTRDVTGSEIPRESARVWANTDGGSATKSTRTRASAKRDASLGVEATLTEREPHNHLPSKTGVRAPVQRALKRAPVPAPEPIPVERALRRARATAPASRRDVGLRVEAILGSSTRMWVWSTLRFRKIDFHRARRNRDACRVSYNSRARAQTYSG